MATSSYDKADGGRKVAQIECHRCPVICERVVYPTHCLKSDCRYVYAFTDESSTYFGCMAKVFTVELDLAAFDPGSTRDPYGALKAQRPPRDECKVQVEQAYGPKYSWQECRNPIFQHHPDEYSPDAIRRLVNGPVRPSRAKGAPCVQPGTEPDPAGD